MAGQAQAPRGRRRVSTTRHLPGLVSASRHDTPTPIRAISRRGLGGTRRGLGACDAPAETPGHLGLAHVVGEHPHRGCADTMGGCQMQRIQGPGPRSPRRDPRRLEASVMSSRGPSTPTRLPFSDGRRCPPHPHQPRPAHAGRTRADRREWAAGDLVRALRGRALGECGAPRAAPRAGGCRRSGCCGPGAAHLPGDLTTADRSATTAPAGWA